MENHSLQGNHMLFMHYGVNESTYIYLMHHDGMRLKMLANIVLFARTPENAQ